MSHGKNLSSLPTFIGHSLNYLIHRIVVNIHKPIYSTVEGAPSFREYIEQYLLEYDVDLVLYGHMHNYERISPLNNYVLTVPPTTLHHADAYYSTGKGPVYVCQGNTGAMQGKINTNTLFMFLAHTHNKLKR